METKKNKFKKSATKRLKLGKTLNKNKLDNFENNKIIQMLALHYNIKLKKK